MIFSDPDNRLHYNLDFLLPAATHTWPPKEDTRRLERYRFAREEFELTPEDLTMQIVPTGLLRLVNFDQFTHAVKLLAYPRLLTLKTIDMILGQPPSISAQGSKDQVTERIKEIRVSSQLDDKFVEGVIDYSRYGVLLLRVYKDEQGKAQVAAWNPHEWVPVYYNDGTRRVHYNVIGWRTSNNSVTVQIHDTSDGSYEQRELMVDDLGVILAVKKSEKFTPGRKLLYSIPNTPTTTNPLGTSDYEIINGLLQKAIERLKAILRVLDEHADPSMIGPYSLLSECEDKDHRGEKVFKTSKYYAIGENEKEPKYLVWEANLDSSFKAFEELCKQIFVLSEMGEAFLGASGGTGNVISGTAMRFKMISPLEKARRMTNKLTNPLKEIISAMLYIEGDEIDPLDINIDWKDSLPKDPREVAELAKLEAGSKAVKPLLHSIMDNFGLDEETAQHYVEQIIKDQQMLEPSDDPNDPSQLINPRIKGGAFDPAKTSNGSEDHRSEIKKPGIDS